MDIFVRNSCVLMVVNDPELTGFALGHLPRGDVSVAEIKRGESADGVIELSKSGYSHYRVNFDFGTGTITSVEQISLGDAINSGYLSPDAARPIETFDGQYYRVIVFDADVVHAQRMARSLFVSALEHHLKTIRQRFAEGEWE